MQNISYTEMMKSDKAIELFLTALAILLVLILFAPRAHASLALFSTPQSTQVILKDGNIVAIATTTVGSSFVTGPYYTITRTTVSIDEQEEIKQLQAQVARLRVLIATLTR